MFSASPVPASTGLQTPRPPFSPRALAQLSGMGAHVDTFLVETHHHLTEDALNCSNKNQHILSPYRGDQAEGFHLILIFSKPIRKHFPLSQVREGTCLRVTQQVSLELVFQVTSDSKAYTAASARIPFLPPAVSWVGSTESRTMVLAQ